MKRRKYTLATLLGIIMAIASTNSTSAHCGPTSSYKNHKGYYAKGKLYGVHRCAYTINKDSKGQKCAVSVTPEGKSYCE